MSLLKRSSTLFLRIVIALIAFGALAFCIWLPQMATIEGASQRADYVFYPFLAYAYIAAVPFFIGLYQAFKLLGYIDADKAFSALSVRALRNIQYCALAILVFIALGEAYLLFFIHEDKAGQVALGIYLAFATIIVATCALVLQKLLHNAAEIKSENDLTV